ncbi:1,4-dihydroxy-2-naphthoate octaprenyltransferase [Bifidobacterium sp.]|uniref:1,4-dihydroxy-2-naphthoate octaprenyltransferase n=1 Tax=Bifidobacterium sp. TaxID=41200 RepID=UPI0039E9B758
MTQRTKPGQDKDESSRVSAHGSRTLWIQAFRPRTLPASIAPVFVGIASAVPILEELQTCPDIYPVPRHCVVNRQTYEQLIGSFWVVAVACVLVALFLQIAVNFANDYSDGIRGSDDARSDDEGGSDKPQRLVASGVNPKYVFAAAAVSALMAAVAGFVAIVVTGHYWFLAIGVACIAACWFYTGGKHPYGYAGLGEIAVFIFFGLIATLGTQYLLVGSVDGLGVLGAINTGLLSSVMLMVNNIRDIDDDMVSGKRTIAARIGKLWAQRLVCAMLVLPVASTIFFAVSSMFVSDFWWLPTIFAVVNVSCAFVAIRTLRGFNPHKFGKALAFSGFILLSYAAAHVVAVAVAL